MRFNGHTCTQETLPKPLERFAGLERFKAEMQRPGYQVAENAGQIVISGNRAPVSG